MLLFLLSVTETTQLPYTSPLSESEEATTTLSESEEATTTLSESQQATTTLSEGQQATTTLSESQKSQKATTRSPELKKNSVGGNATGSTTPAGDKAGPSIKKLIDILKQAHDVWSGGENSTSSGGPNGNRGKNGTEPDMDEPIQSKGSKQYQRAINNLDGALDRAALKLDKTLLSKTAATDGQRPKKKKGCGQTYTSHNGLDNLVGGKLLFKSSLVSGNTWNPQNQHRLPVDCIENVATPHRIVANRPANLRMGKFSIPKFASSRAQPSSIPNFKSGLPPASRIQYTRANADARYNSAYDRHPSSMFIQLSTVESGSLSRQQMSSHARAAIDLGRASADRTLSEILLKASAQDGAQKMVDATVPTADSELNAALASHNNAAEALRFQRTPRSSNKESINRNYNLPAVPGSKLFEETRKWMLKNDPDLHRQMTASKARFASYVYTSRLLHVHSPVPTYLPET